MVIYICIYKWINEYAYLIKYCCEWTLNTRCFYNVSPFLYPRLKWMARYLFSVDLKCHLLESFKVLPAINPRFVHSYPSFFLNFVNICHFWCTRWKKKVFQLFLIIFKVPPAKNPSSIDFLVFFFFCFWWEDSEYAITNLWKRLYFR